MRLEQSDAFRAKLTEYVEDELDALVQSAAQEGTQLAWSERLPLAWLISVLSGPNAGEYDSIAAPDMGFS